MSSDKCCTACTVLGQGLSCAICWTVGSALLVETVGKLEIGLAAGYVSTPNLILWCLKRIKTDVTLHESEYFEGNLGCTNARWRGLQQSRNLCRVLHGVRIACFGCLPPPVNGTLMKRPTRKPPTPLMTRKRRRVWVKGFLR